MTLIVSLAYAATVTATPPLPADWHPTCWVHRDDLNEPAQNGTEPFRPAATYPPGPDESGT